MDVLIAMAAVVLVFSLGQLAVGVWRLQPDSDAQIRRFQSQYRPPELVPYVEGNSDGGTDLMNEWSQLFEAGITGV